MGDLILTPIEIIVGDISGGMKCEYSPLTIFQADRILRNLKDYDNKPITSKDVYNLSKRMRNNDDVNEVNLSINNYVDRISDLPNDVLLYLLSFVDMKTAGRTSLLSKRWRYISTYLIHLDFEHPEFYLIQQYPVHIRSDDYNKYCKWVNQVITGNRASYLSTFRIHFPLYESYAADIGKWIAIALSKNVQNLELNLSDCTGCPIMRNNNYIIRQDFISNNRVIALKTIHLEALVVEGDVVEYVLSNRLNLERLTVKYCEFYLCGSVGISPKTELVVSSSKLKHLELSGCDKIKSIQISTPNLTWFKFLGVNGEIQYTSVPALVNVTFEHRYWYFNRKLNVFSKFSTQLEQLSLFWSLKETSLPTNFPRFPNVKQLEIYVMLSNDGKDNLLVLIPVIKACPVLHTFKLKIFYIHRLSRSPAMSVQNDVQIETIRAHKHLAVVEFARFSGIASEVNLALCLAEHASMLNKLILDPHHPQMGGNLHIYVDFTNIIVENISLWRRRAEALAKRIRRGVDVVIL